MFRMCNIGALDKRIRRLRGGLFRRRFSPPENSVKDIIERTCEDLFLSGFRSSAIIFTIADKINREQQKFHELITRKMKRNVSRDYRKLNIPNDSFYNGRFSMFIIANL